MGSVFMDMKNWKPPEFQVPIIEPQKTFRQKIARYSPQVKQALIGAGVTILLAAIGLWFQHSSYSKENGRLKQEIVSKDGQIADLIRRRDKAEAKAHEDENALAPWVQLANSQFTNTPMTKRLDQLFDAVSASINVSTSLLQAIQIITNILKPEVLKQLPPEREKEYQAEVASDFADYDKVMKRLREIAFPWVANVVVTNLSLTNGLKPLDTNALLRLYFTNVQTSINQYLATTNFLPEFRQRYNEWVQLQKRMHVQDGLLELALAWQDKITNGSIPSDPEVLRVNFEPIKEKIVSDGIAIIEGKIAYAESDFQLWTTTNSFARYLARYGK